jgi:hypothetical protein
MFWQRYYSRGNYYSPLQALFAIGLVFSIILMMSSMMFSLYQYDLMRRKGTTYGYYPGEEEEED